MKNNFDNLDQVRIRCLPACMIQQQKLRKEAILLYIIWKAEILYWTCTWPLNGIKKMQE